MSEDEIPQFIIDVPCPHCGAPLQIEKKGEDAQPDDRVICPTHGDICSYAEAKPIAREAAMEKAKEEAHKAVADMLKRGGFR